MKTKLLSSHVVTKVVLFGAAAFLVCGFFVVGNVAKAATWTVDASVSTSTCGVTASTCSSIQSAITAATSNDIINVASGTYPGALNLGYKTLTIEGAGVGNTIIDASSLSGYAIQNFGTSSVISGLTLRGPGVVNKSSYGFKISHVANITLENIAVENSYKTGIDLNTVNGANLSNITVSSTTNGFGLMIKDSQDINVSNVATNGNVWGGVSVQTASTTSNNVSFTGTFSATESFPLLLENDPNGSAYYDITNIQLPSQFGYITYAFREKENPSTIQNYKQWFYFQNLSDAETAASAFATSTAYTYTGITVSDVGGSNYSVVNGLKIQDAINAVATSGTVTVATGTYAETLQINKALTLLGTQYNADARTRSTSSESIIASSDVNGSIQIGSSGPVTGTVTIKGFTIGNSTTSPYKAIHVMQKTDNVDVENNIIEPSTYDGINLYSAVQGTINQNLVLGAATSGITMGSDATPNIVTQATITNNKVEDSEYGITGYMASSTISNNEVVGSSTQADGSGIGGEFYNTSITNNTVSGYSAGAGIGFKNDHSPARADASGMTISGNEVYGNGYNFYAVSDSSAATTTVSGNYFESPVGVNTLMLNTLTSGYSFSGNYYSDWPGTGDYAISGTDDGTTVSTTSSAFTDTSPMVRPVYVSNSGTDGPTYGSEANPYKTIQYGIDNVTPSGKVYVAAGTYAGSLVIDKSLTLVGNGDTKPVISGVSTANYIVKIDGADGVTLDNLEINGGSSNNFNYGIQVTGAGVSANPVEIENSTIKNVWSTAGANGVDISSSSYALVHDNTISSFYKRGVRFTNSDGKVYNNDVYGENVNGVTRVQNLVNLWGGSDVEIYGNALHNALTAIGSTPVWDSPAIFVSSFGGNGASHANVHNNEIYNGDTGITVGSIYVGTSADPAGNTADESTVDVVNNTLHDLNSGVNFERDDVSAVVHGNYFSNMREKAVNYDSSLTIGPVVNAENNYWGTTSSTEIEALVYNGVDYTPWSNGLQSETNVDADAQEVIISTNATSSTSTVNVPEDATSTTLNVAALLSTSTNSATLPGAINVNASTTVGDVNVQIPADITITGASGWTGIINVPQVEANNTVSVVADSGNNATVSSVIAVGYGDVPLTFDKAVRILIAGQAGKYVGYSRGSVFTAITNTCSADTQAVGNALPAAGDCKINAGSDLAIWTKHFTSFVTYTQTAIPAAIVTGGGGGSYPWWYTTPTSTAVATATMTATAPAAAPAGQVLGAQAFRFTEDLSEGMQGDNVTELQNRLTSEGVYSGPTTGYFGPLTLAGVKSYQAKYNLPTTGFVGPMTRTQLNAALESGKVLGASTTGTAEMIQSIQGIVQSLQAKGGQEKVISVLQMVLAFLQNQ